MPAVQSYAGFMEEKIRFEKRVVADGFGDELRSRRSSIMAKHRKAKFQDIWTTLMHLFPAGEDGKTVPQPFDRSIPELKTFASVGVEYTGPVATIVVPTVTKDVAAPPVKKKGRPKKKGEKEAASNEEFKIGKRITTRQKVEWIFEHLHMPIEEVPTTAAPSVGTWAMFRWAKSSPMNLNTFYSTWVPKFVPSKAELEAAERFQDDGRSLNDFMDRIEKELAKENNRSGGLTTEPSLPPGDIGSGIRGPGVRA